MSRTRAYLSVICPCLPVIPWLKVIVLAASRILLRRHRRTFHLLIRGRVVELLRKAHSPEDADSAEMPAQRVDLLKKFTMSTGIFTASLTYYLLRVRVRPTPFADFHPCTFDEGCRAGAGCVLEALEIRSGARATPRWTPPGLSPVADIQPRLRPTASVRAAIGSPNTRHTLRRRTRTVGDAQT